VKRVAVIFAGSLLMLFHGACGADVNVRVDTQSGSSEQFLVTVYTRHADFHNGYSRIRFTGLVQANASTTVAIGFYISLIGYGVTAYHPDYDVEAVVTRSRRVDPPALVARRWDAILDRMTSLPYYGTGGGVSYFRLLSHIEGYAGNFLPALDRAGVDPDPAVVARFTALLAKADALAVPSTIDVERGGQARLKEQRARVLPELEKWLDLTRAQRLAIADFRSVTIGAKPMIAALQKDAGFPGLLAFVAGVHAERAERLPQVHSWETGTGLRMTYRLVEWQRARSDGEPRGCARGQLVLDARPIAKGYFPDLVRQANYVDFCRDRAGRWSLESRRTYTSNTVGRWVDDPAAGGGRR
jgi:hypothetical protein